MNITEELIQEAIVLYQNNLMSVLDIANKFGLKYNDLYPILRKRTQLRDIGEVNRVTTPEQESNIIREYQLGGTLRGLSRTYNFDRSVIQRVLRENGVQLRSQSLPKKNIDLDSLYSRYKQGENFSSLSKAFDITIITVIRKLRKIDPNIQSRLSTAVYNSTLPDIIQSKICQEYLNGESCVKVAHRHNIHHNAVAAILRSKGFSLRKPGSDNKLYSINENVFELSNIHNPSTYITLGLLFTDGTVIWKEKKAVCIELNSADRNTLDFINQSLGSNRPLLEFTPKNTLILSISNKKLAYDLIQLGCIPNKTYSLTLPTWIRPDLFRHFLHGVIMGDGCISKNKVGDTYSVSICGNKDFCIGIQNELTKQLGIKGYLSQGAESFAWNLAIGGNGQVLRLCNFIFETAPFIMDRKFNIYQDLVNFKSESVRNNKNDRTDHEVLAKAVEIINFHKK